MQCCGCPVPLLCLVPQQGKDNHCPRVHCSTLGYSLAGGQELSSLSRAFSDLVGNMLLVRRLLLYVSPGASSVRLPKPDYWVAKHSSALNCVA